MNNNIKERINNSQFTTICYLHAIQDTCPWKKYEGLTPKEFVEQNFSTLKKHTSIFEDLIATACLDIIFIEVYSEKLQKNYWFCVYYFGDDEDGRAKYFVGGEPEQDVTLSKQIKEKSCLKEFPSTLKEFWSIHGIFDIQIAYGKKDFNIPHLKENLSPEDGEGKIPHYTSLLSTGEEIGITEWTALDEGYISINDLGNTDFDEDKNFNKTYFIEEYLKKGLYFMDVNGDVILLIDSYQDFPNFFYLCHDCGSNFYGSFWDYLTTDFMYLK